MDVSQAGLFMKINIAAQRARQIMQGAVPRLQTRSRKPGAIAISEVEAGLVEAYLPAELPDDPEEALLDDAEDEEQF